MCKIDTNINVCINAPEEKGTCYFLDMISTIYSQPLYGEAAIHRAARFRIIGNGNVWVLRPVNMLMSL